MLLAGKKGLVLSVTNDKSIGWGIAEAAVAHGAEVGLGAQNERMLEKVSRLIEGRPGFKAFTCDAGNDEEIAKLADDVANTYGKIDFLVHSMAYAPREDLMGRFIDTSREGFLTAVDISAYTLVALSKALEPHMNDGASVITISFVGSTRAASNYKVMGIAKAALEASVRYLSVDLGQRQIRVNTLSPGPINTVAARGVAGLLQMIEFVNDKAPLKREYGIDDVGGSAVYLMSDLSKAITGQIIFVDSGFSYVGV